MKWIVLSAVVLLAVAVLAWLARPSARMERRARRAEATFARLTHLPPKLAQESLERAVTAKQQRFPGRARAWYVEQVVKDLRRDRR